MVIIIAITIIVALIMKAERCTDAARPFRNVHPDGILAFLRVERKLPFTLYYIIRRCHAAVHRSRVH